MVGRRGMRLGVAGAVAAATAVAIGVPGAVAATEVELVLRAVEVQNKDTDTGPKGPSVGDRSAFSEDLYKSGTKVGRDAVECVTVRVVRRDRAIRSVDLQCVATLRLDRGQIAVQGLVTYTVADPEPLRLVITGGSGAYERATGEMLVEPINTAGTQSKLTLDMTVG